ncbi:MAG: hypothetical protein DWQ02_15030 [Bacteroidetes bacterium]|nr:MAG: hypothetical protein DWQ02_15030 [Bacteroidota bacterium]
MSTKKELVKKATGCCPEILKEKQCNALDFHYRLVNITRVNNRRVPVEILIHARLEKCKEGLELGKLAYSTTLFPGEKVNLFTADRRTRFSFDKETSLSYRHEQTHESQYYMASMDKMMSDLNITDKGSAQSSSQSDFSTTGSTSGAIETFFAGASVNVRGNFNASSTSDFVRELSRHAEASHNRSVEATHASSSVSVGEVQTRTHAEGETESHFEASSRSFANPNTCHAITYFFHQINERYSIKFRVVSIKRRVIDTAGDSGVSNRPIASKGKVAVLPAVITADNPNRIDIEEKARVSETLAYQNPVLSKTSSPLLTTNLVLAQPIVTGDADSNIDEEVRTKALNQVDNDLIAKGLIAKGSKEITEEMRAELEFSITTSLPTPGLMVKSCLDDCCICEPELKAKMELDLERKKLKNELLKKQIDLLEKSQEYRCCPTPEKEDEDDD